MTKRLSILVVDDQPEIRAALRRCLNAYGNKILEAGSGEDALSLVKSESIDAVVTDYDMPGMNGLELLKRLRIMKPAMRRILLTGRADVRIAARALNEGCVHRFLLKPWQDYDLEGIVRITLSTAE